MMSTAITQSAMKKAVDYLYERTDAIKDAPLDSIIGAVHMATLLDEERQSIMDNISALIGENKDGFPIHKIAEIVWGELA